MNLEVINIISYMSVDTTERLNWTTEIWTLMRFSFFFYFSDRKKCSISLKIIHIIFWSKVMFIDLRNLVNMGRRFFSAPFIMWDASEPNMKQTISDIVIAKSEKSRK